MLTDFLVATPEEAEAIGSAAGEHWKRWPSVTLKHVDPFKLASLWKLLSPGVDAKEMCSAESMLHDGDEAWLFALPGEFVARLAEVGGARARVIGSRWSDTDELVADRFSREDSIEVVESLSRLAKQSIDEGKAMLLWMSL